MPMATPCFGTPRESTAMPPLILLFFHGMTLRVTANAGGLTGMAQCTISRAESPLIGLPFPHRRHPRQSDGTIRPQGWLHIPTTEIAASTSLAARTPTSDRNRRRRVWEEPRSWTAPSHWPSNPHSRISTVEFQDLASVDSLTTASGSRDQVEVSESCFRTFELFSEWTRLHDLSGLFPNLFQ